VVAFLLLAGPLLWMRQIPSVEIPVNATVLNSPPVLIELRIKQPTVDPNAFFQIALKAGDNNTLRDIRDITVDMTSGSGTDTCRFIWDASGYSRLWGEGTLSTSTSRYPSDSMVSMGEWTMEVRLPGHLPAGQWELTATVRDEDLSSTRTILFWVNSYVSISMDQPSFLNLKVPPGSPGQTSQSRFVLTYTSNTPVDLLARSTPFKGTSDDSFELSPSDFTVSVDGREGIALSEQAVEIATGMPPGPDSGIGIIIAVEIPQPFYDQEYEGRLTLTLRPR
jgi:hypothetical protein